MKDLSENELLSAYLDGELRADEQAEVEALLARDPAAREFVTELRTLGAAVRSLPTYTLGADFSGSVVSLAKRSEDSEPDALRVVLGKRLLRPRAWVWPGVAVAVALAFMVMENLQPSEDGATDGQVAEQSNHGGSGGHSAPTFIASIEDPKEVGPTPHAPMANPINLAIHCKVVDVTTAGEVLQGLFASRLIEPTEPVAKPDGSTYVEAVLKASQLRAVLVDLQQRADQFPTVLSPPGFTPDDESTYLVRFVFRPL